MTSLNVKANVFFFNTIQDANKITRSSQGEETAIFWSNFIKKIVWSDSSLYI